MIRVVLYLVGVAALATGLSWLADRPGSLVINWEGYEEQLAFLWQKQSHIFGMPFYYIEYAIAQLGALAVWKNYKQDPQKGLDGYLNALKMGYTRPIPEVYEAAGIRFDFSEDYIRDIVEFCLAEYKAIEL